MRARAPPTPLARLTRPLLAGLTPTALSRAVAIVAYYLRTAVDVAALSFGDSIPSDTHINTLCSGLPQCKSLLAFEYVLGRRRRRPARVAAHAPPLRS